MLESNCHSDSSFVTLTYADEHLPRIKPTCSPSTALSLPSLLDDGLVATLIPEHLQNFLKRYRKAIEPTRIRFYGVGEYGDKTERPHYHLAIFGVPSCQRGTTKADRKGNAEIDPQTGKGKYLSRAIGSCCGSCDTVQDAWKLGRVYLGELNSHSAQYIAGYVTKKMTMNDDPRLYGRHPEFSRMSNREGIGKPFLPIIANELDRWDIVNRMGDVPSSLRHGSKHWPLGRYLTKNLRKITTGSEYAPQQTIEKIQAEVSDVRAAAFNDSESFEVALQRKMKPTALRNQARASIYKTRKTL